MHLETLSIFCDIVRHHSFSRGAAANDVSQSAASQAVHHLERRLGTQLIDRSKRPWRLTTDGKLFFKGCQELVDRYHEVEDTVRRRQHPSGYRIRLATIYSVHLHDLSLYIDWLRESLPDVDVDVAYMHPDQVYEQVLADQCDLGLLSFANPGRELTVIPWVDQPMVIACLPSHCFAAAATTGVTPSALSGESFIAFDRGLPVRREIDRYLRRNDVEVKVAAAFDSIENIKQAIEDGAGVAILPEPTLQREVDRQTLVKVPLRRVGNDTPPVRPMSIIRRRKRRLNPAVTAFITVLLAERAVRPEDRAGGSTPAEPKIGAAI